MRLSTGVDYMSWQVHQLLRICVVVGVRTLQVQIPALYEYVSCFTVMDAPKGTNGPQLLLVNP